MALVRALLIALLPTLALAAGHEDNPLKSWFDSLASKRGAACCSVADGFSLSPDDVDIKDGRYRVRFWGQWHDVPDDALVIAPNRFGQPVVWPVRVGRDQVVIRCFMPGALT